jgi:type IV pilus assembly protein PilB
MKIKNDSILEAGGKIARAVLYDAIKSGVSDIHLEPEFWGMKMRYRIDGVMHDIMEIPPEFQIPLTEQLKDIAGMDHAITQSPQEGKIWLPREEEQYLFIASSLPVIYGERIVLHLVMHPLLDRPLEDLGFSAPQAQTMAKLLEARQGLFVITGSLGDGRSTTALNLMKKLQAGGRRCAAIEDSPSYEMEEIVQIGGLGALGPDGIARSLEAAAPDVVLLDEVLNLFTLQLLMKLLAEKKLVLTITRSRDAFTAIADIEAMGLPRALCAESLRGVLAQKLVKMICPDCREPVTGEGSHGPDDDGDPILIAAPHYRGRGCDACHGTGYRGRTVITQLIDDGSLQSGLREGLSIKDIRAGLGDAANDLIASAGEKCAGGLTTREEIARVLKVPWREVKYERE